MAHPKRRVSTGAGVIAKLEWAAHHFKVLDEEIRPWAESHLDCIAGQVHGEGKTHVYRPQYVPDVPPRWPLMVGDSIHNARAALDHLAWQLVIADGGCPGRKTAFPIRLQPKRTMIRPSVSKPIRREIKAIQPDSARHWLYVLRELDNVDKHRTVLVVDTASTGARQGQSAGRVVLLGQRVELNKPVGKVEFSQPQPDIQPDVKFPVGIGFDEPGVPSVSAVNVGLVLRSIIDWINDSLIPRFQPFIADLQPLPAIHWLSPPSALPR